jgi:osmotically-inducible protein OsmY
MKSNEQLQKDVQDAIKWEPLLNAAEIGVTAKDGVVSLTGVVNSYSKKMQAEDAAKNVAGVTAVVEEIEIKYDGGWSKGDNEVANEVVAAIKGNWEVPKDKVKVKVENGWVTLDGEVEWNYQRDAAKTAIVNLAGVRNVSNNITIKSQSGSDLIEKGAIECALDRSWSLDDQDIDVEVKNHNVTLTGVVDSIYQKEEAGRIAWNAPGVWSMKNELVVEYND